MHDKTRKHLDRSTKLQEQPEKAELEEDEVMELAIEAQQAVRRQQREQSSGNQALLDLARKAEREGWQGPKDLSTNHNAYFAQDMHTLGENR